MCRWRDEGNERKGTWGGEFLVRPPALTLKGGGWVVKHPPPRGGGGGGVDDLLGATLGGGHRLSHPCGSTGGPISLTGVDGCARFTHWSVSWTMRCSTGRISWHATSTLPLCPLWEPLWPPRHCFAAGSEYEIEEAVTIRPFMPLSLIGSDQAFVPFWGVLARSFLKVAEEGRRGMGGQPKEPLKRALPHLWTIAGLVAAKKRLSRPTVGRSDSFGQFW